MARLSWLLELRQGSSGAVSGWEEPDEQPKDPMGMGTLSDGGDLERRWGIEDRVEPTMARGRRAGQKLTVIADLAGNR